MTSKTAQKCEWIGAGERCGESAVPGRSYCEEHLWRVHQQGTAVRRRKDQRRADTVRELESLMNDAVEQLIEEGWDL